MADGKSTFAQSWLKARIETYREMNPRFLSSLVMIGAAGSAALVAIAYAKAMDWATLMMANWSTVHQWYFLAASPFWFILAWALVRYGAPDAGGSGIPYVMASIEQAAASRGAVGPSIRNNLKILAVKIASSLAVTLGGGIVGREGPTIQLSSTVFELFDGLFKKYVSFQRSREALLIAGGGAGLAAAFNTPLGGVVFAIEELAHNHFKTFKGMLILSVVTAGYVTQAVLGPYLFIGHPSIGNGNWRETTGSLAAAVGIGILGALFGVVLFRIVTIMRRLTTVQRLAVIGGLGLLMAGACILLGPDAGGGGNLLIRKLLFGNAAGAVVQVSWPLAIWRTVGLILTYVTGCAGGIFAPSLAAGASISAVLAQLFHFENHNLIIVVGMIAFLTGATRSPFTSFILVFEMTDRQAAVVPMMAAALLANMAARLVDADSFYERTRDLLLVPGGEPAVAVVNAGDVTPAPK